MNTGKGEVSQRKYGSFWRRWLTRWLVARLRTKSIEKRSYILQALGKIGDETALPVILNAATDTNDTIRSFALSALSDLGDIRAIDALIDALDDSESDIRAAAAMSLGRFEGDRTESVLIGLLDDKDISVRTQAIIGLGHIGSIQVLPLLKQMIVTESGEWMRRYINQSIREIMGKIPHNPEEGGLC